MKCLHDRHLAGTEGWLQLIPLERVWHVPYLGLQWTPSPQAWLTAGCNAGGPTLTEQAPAELHPWCCRFMLLLHIRLARSFPDLQQRRMAVQARLLAFHVLFQSSLNQDSQALAADAEFVPELMGLLAEVCCFDLHCQPPHCLVTCMCGLGLTSKACMTGWIVNIAAAACCLPACHATYLRERLCAISTPPPHCCPT